MNPITLWFLNLETREERSVEMLLHKYWCNLDNAIRYQLRSADETFWADDAETPQEAVDNGAWITLPEKEWKWVDICRWGARKPTTT